MTLRDGGSPRDGNPVRSDTGSSRVRQAHRIDEMAIDDDHFARPPAPLDRDPGRPLGGPNGRRESRRGGGLGGLLRFLLFIAVLAGIVLVASLTVLRPVIAHAVVDYAAKKVGIGWTSTLPGSLGQAFVDAEAQKVLSGQVTVEQAGKDQQKQFETYKSQNG